MTGHEYERVVARYLQRHGYYGVEVTRGSGDFGVDIIVHRGLTKYAVQCKYYSSPVSLGAVQEVVAGKAYYGCDSAIVVTNSTFTAAAKELATQNGVRLIEHVNGFGFGIPPKWLLIIAGLYILFVVAPIASIIYDILKEDHSPGRVINAIGSFIVVTLPFWILPVLRLVFRLLSRAANWLAEYLRAQKKSVQPTVQAPEHTEPRKVIDPGYALALIDDQEMPEYDKHLVELAREAIIACADQNRISASLIQRRCRIGFATAEKVTQVLKDCGLIEANEQNQRAYRWAEKAKHGGDES